MEAQHYIHWSTFQSGLFGPFVRSQRGQIMLGTLSSDRSGYLGSMEAESSVATLNTTNQTGEPTIPGTNIPQHRIAALIDAGLTVDEVAADFPSLSSSQIRAAMRFSRKHPARTIYPNKSLKRLLTTTRFRDLEKMVKKAKSAWRT
jgi:uncharacterized protein (DUF433 family)